MESVHKVPGPPSLEHPLRRSGTQNGSGIGQNFESTARKMRALADSTICCLLLERVLNAKDCASNRADSWKSETFVGGHIFLRRGS